MFFPFFWFALFVAVARAFKVAYLSKRKFFGQTHHAGGKKLECGIYLYGRGGDVA
jgi:hypothetical protein